ncbi:DUF1516 family protein [Exiguobacterium sp. Helios]|uniref:DUF1516 family protein n=1 Tax=unclassified Exiguobacterium TaxID=2644629 RepID=UPI00103B376E|nr:MULTISPECIES: DUF1516 family protein [unclassified Exiguobacterium]QNR20361.1 DUF1516 family protein [Exiguobacterium sp. Helios]
MPITAFVHTHVLLWVLLLVTFFVAFSMYKNGKSAAKGVHMAFRLLLLLTFATGLYLYIKIMGMSANPDGLYHAKITAGLLVLILGELTLVRLKKGKSYSGFLLGFGVLVLVTIFLGYSLPYGMQFF